MRLRVVCLLMFCFVLVPANALTTGVEVINVKDFGAVGDGLADDTAAIDAAFTAARDMEGARVYLPKGVYRVVPVCPTEDEADPPPNPRFRLTDGTIVEGDGRDLTTISVASSATCEWSLFSVEADQSATIRNLAIDGPGAEVQQCIAVWHLGGGGGMTAENVRVSSFHRAFKKDPGQSTVAIRNCDLSTYLSSYLSSGGGKHDVVNTRFHDIGTDKNHHGVYIKKPFVQLLLNACSFEDITGSGLQQYGRSESTSQEGCGPVSVVGCIFRDTGVRGVVIDNDCNHATAITGNVFANGHTGVDVRTDNAVITGNSFFTVSHGVISHRSDADNSPGSFGTISGNQFYDNQPNGNYIAIEIQMEARGWTISGNTFVDDGNGYFEGIRLSGALDTNISNNNFRLQNGPGVRVMNIEIDATDYKADRVAISGNLFTGSTANSGAIYLDAKAANPITAAISSNLICTTDQQINEDVTGATTAGNMTCP